MDDSKIIDLYFSRDEAAIKETEAKYEKLMMSVSKSITADEEDAKECVNDTYMRLWNSIPPQNPKSLKAYILKIVRNLSLDIYDRKNAKKRQGIVVELSKELENCIPVCLDISDSSSILSELINTFIKSLNDESQYIFVQRYFMMKSVSEIAENVGKSESNISQILFRTRVKLKKHLESEGYKL